MRTLIFCPCKMKLFFLLFIFSGIVLATTPQQGLFLESIKRGDLNKVTEMVEEHPEFDPSFDDNTAIHAAIRTNHYEIIELLLSNPRVIETVFLRRLAVECGLHGSRYNHIIKRYLESGDVHDNFFDICYSATIFCNREILEILVADTRVDVRNALNYGLNTMIKNSSTFLAERAEGIIRFLLENEHINRVEYFKNPMAQLALEHDNLRLLVELTSPDCSGPLALNRNYLKELLDHGKNELPIIALALVPGMVGTLEPFISEDVQWITEPIQWFAQSSIEELKDSREKIKAQKPEIQTAFLVHAVLLYETEKVWLLFSLNLQLNYKMIAIMMATLATCEDLDMFIYCCSQESIIHWLTVEKLNTLTEWYIQHNKSEGKSQMFRIYFLKSDSFCSLHEQLAELGGNIVELEDSLKEFRDKVDELEKLDLTGLAVLGKLALAHHTAMLAIHTQGIYIPLEIRNNILNELLKQNE